MEPDQSAALDGMSGEVTYYPNRTTFGKQRCLIEWTTAGRLRLTAVDKKTGEPIDSILDEPISTVRVKRMRGTVLGIVLSVGDVKYKLDFAPGANFARGVGGLAGAALTRKISKGSDGPTWIQAFTSAGLME